MNEFIIFISAFFMGVFVGFLMCKDLKGDFDKEQNNDS